ncbi:hypothetical protein LMH87_004087 [Akanthomyces muscarius]|uniref:Uncharacterized protein n=1 Tax=Akanthomyces muscarius TaxID=2231603 RepID=A0A9W8Q4Y6_AKAMU|nr:hypothetical protein LMH87_004087 [Akanthomyces muscarius]KAJ4145232.1 hypothetical protein LMH87_004087 [Akanthomyces muscarius]
MESSVNENANFKVRGIWRSAYYQSGHYQFSLASEELQRFSIISGHSLASDRVLPRINSYSAVRGLCARDKDATPLPHETLP